VANTNKILVVKSRNILSLEMQNQKKWNEYYTLAFF
jgi:hypothetical protein